MRGRLGTQSGVSKDPLDKAADNAKKNIDNTRDAIHEAHHRSMAEAEEAKRKALRDHLSPGEKAGSALNEAKHRTQAEIDAAKHDLRNKT